MWASEASQTQASKFWTQNLAKALKIISVACVQCSQSRSTVPWLRLHAPHFHTHLIAMSTMWLCPQKACELHKSTGWMHNNLANLLHTTVPKSCSKFKLTKSCSAKQLNRKVSKRDCHIFLLRSTPSAYIARAWRTFLTRKNYLWWKVTKTALPS